MAVVPKQSGVLSPIPSRCSLRFVGAIRTGNRARHRATRRKIHVVPRGLSDGALAIQAPLLSKHFAEDLLLRGTMDI
jgi:hypothetical protein